MKLEAECDNPVCSSLGHRDVYEGRLGFSEGEPRGYDIDHNRLTCRWCGMETLYRISLAPDGAVFAVGEVKVSNTVHMMFGLEAWHVASALVERHRRADYGSITPEVFTANMTALSETPRSYGRVFSSYVHEDQILLVITERSRKRTHVLLAEEDLGTTET